MDIKLRARLSAYSRIAPSDPSTPDTPVNPDIPDTPVNPDIPDTIKDITVVGKTEEGKYILIPVAERNDIKTMFDSNYTATEDDISALFAK